MRYTADTLCVALFTAAVLAFQASPAGCAAAGDAALTEASERLDFANGLFGRKMYKMAAAEYGAFTASYPGSPELPRAYFMSGESLFYLGDYRAATAAYEEYLARFPDGKDAAHARLRLIASAIELKDCDRALKAAAPFAAGAHPPEIRGEALYLTGLARLACGEKDAAIRSFREAWSLGSSSTYAAVAAYQLGRVMRGGGDLSDAVDWFDKAAALAADGDMRAVATLGAAEARIDLGEYAAAADLLRPAAFGPAGPSETRDRAVLGLVRALYGMKEYAAAIDAYKQARADLRSSPLRMQAALFVAQAYTKEGRGDEAVDLLDLILADTALSPAEAETVFFAKAAALIAAKRYEDARSLLASRTGYSDMARADFLKAETSYYLKSYGEARKAYDAFLAAYPDSPLRAQALYGMAFAAVDNGEKRVARDVFLRVVADFPDHDLAARALYSATALDSDLGLREDGLAHAGAYLERYGDREDAKAIRLLLGRLYADLKRPAEAIRVYADYIARYPGDARTQEAYFLMGRSYQALGDAARSNEYFSKITKDAPGGGEFYYPARQHSAQNYIAMKQELEAAKMMDEVLAGDPRQAQAFDAYIWVAKRYIDAKLYDEALRVLLLAGKRADAAPNAAAIAYYTSEVERGRGNYDAAIAGYGQCIRDEAGEGAYTGPAHQGIGLSFMAMQEPVRARQAFEDAIAYNPSDNTVVMRSRYYLADLLALEGKTDEAAKTYMMVAILYDDASFVPSALYKAILAFDKIGKKDEAEKASRDFLARFPGDERSGEIRKILDTLGYAAG